jgi:peptidoglycan/xylan/chitin deacetylase (PgdA/CDA1 family)
MTTRAPLPPTVVVMGSRRSDAVGRWLAGAQHVVGGLQPLVGPSLRLVSSVIDPAPGGGSWIGVEAEAAAVRLRRDGREWRTTTTDEPMSKRELAFSSFERGRRSVDHLRLDPGLVSEMQAGGWYNAGWRSRAVRRILVPLPLPSAVLTVLPPRWTADIAFWRGVRRRATRSEWLRLTACSYVALCYHRLSGEMLEGEERMDVAPHSFAGQQRLLRRLGWRPLGLRDLSDFHQGRGPRLVRRFVLTADDGFEEALAELTAWGKHQPQAFVVSSAIGGTAAWLNDARCAGREALLEFHLRGGLVGSHARRHCPLDQLDEESIREEVEGSHDEISQHLGFADPVFAYPHGAHDARVRAAVRDAGYALAWTTRQGRNGWGTDKWCLRRVEPKAWDSALSFLFKVCTGESPPAWWERRLERRWRARRAAIAPSV